MTDPDWEGGQPRSKLVPLVLLVAGALAGGALLGQGQGLAPAPEGLSIEETPAPPAPAATEASPVMLAGRWDRTSVGPLAGRSGATAVWTGNEVMVWGGLGTELYADGALYSPSADRWRRVARSPLRPRLGAAGLWVDGEVLILGGRLFRNADDGPTARPRTTNAIDGAAYAPATNTWRPLPPLPFPVTAGGVFESAGRLYAVSAAARARPLAVLDRGAAFWRLADGPAGWRRGGETAVARVDDMLMMWPSDGGDAVGVYLASEQWITINRVEPPSTPLRCDCRLYAGTLPSGAVQVAGYEPGHQRWWRAPFPGGSNVVTTAALLYLVGPPRPTLAVDRLTGETMDVPGAPLGLGLQPTTTLAGDRVFAWGGVRSLRRLFTADGLIFTPS